MVNDPRDPAAYRMAITFLGLAVLVALGGIGWVAAEHRCVHNIPVQIWSLGGAISGVFVGALIPFALRTGFSRGRGSERPSYTWDPLAITGAVILTVLCLAALIAGLIRPSPDFDAVAATFAGVLLGLPIPSPGRRDP